MKLILMEYANIWIANSAHYLILMRFKLDKVDFCNGLLTFTTINKKFILCFTFQTSCQVSQNDGHCVWHGICYQKDKIKNCAYDGPPKVLNESGVVALKEWCSHLLPQNYADGQDVLTCCDNAQVRFPDQQFTFLLRMLMSTLSRPIVEGLQRKHQIGCEPSQPMSFMHEQSGETHLWVHVQSTSIDVYRCPRDSSQSR